MYIADEVFQAAGWPHIFYPKRYDHQASIKCPFDFSLDMFGAICLSRKDQNEDATRLDAFHDRRSPGNSWNYISGRYPTANPFRL
jgi:hypothetical protein